jgi:hypothetical protein
MPNEVALVMAPCFMISGIYFALISWHYILKIMLDPIEPQYRVLKENIVTGCSEGDIIKYNFV